MEKPFQGLATFLKSPVGHTSRDIGVIGIPFDGATSYRPGARFAPNAIRQASMMLTDGAHPTLGINPCERVSDFGDIAVSNLDVAKSLGQITTAIGTHMGAAPWQRLLMMGGDHTVTTGILRAIAPQHPDLFVLHLDAHCDTWADHFGDPLGHGTWVRNVVEEGLVEPSSILQVGIRSPVDPETKAWLPNLGGRVLTSRQIDIIDRDSRFGHNAVGHVLAKVPRDRPVYVSVDIDCLDPAYAPGTGTPEIAGLTPHFVLGLMEGLKARNVVAADLVEVNPSYDPAGITALAGATILWTLAGVMASNLEARS